MDIEAYKIAVKIALTENVSKGLMAISGKFATTNKEAELFQKKMEQIGKMTLTGGALVGVGLLITKGLDSTLKAARDLVKAQNDFKTLNLSAQDMALVNSNAIMLSHKTLGTTIAGNIRLTQDLHTAFGDLNHAIAVSPSFAKYEASVRMALGEGAVDGQSNAAARALEHRGGRVVNNPQEFNSELSMMSQVQFSTKNRVSPRDYLAASQSGKMAYALLDKDYLYGGFAGLMTMNGGFQSGTALMTAFSSLIGGHMDKKAKGALSDIGMYDEGVSKARLQIMQNAMKGMTPDEKKLYIQSVGGESLLSGGLKSEYASMFSNPQKLAEVMAQHIRDKYGKSLTDEQIAEWMARNFNRNTGGFLGMQILNDQKYTKDTGIFRRGQDFNQAYDTYLNSPDGAATALSGAWTNLKAILGLQLLPTVTSLTLKFAKFIDAIGDFAEKNPWAAKIAMYSATAVAGLSLLSGGILLLGATIMAARLVGSLGMLGSVATVLGGPVVWAVVALAGAGIYLYKNWGKARPLLKQMGSEFGWIASQIWDRVKKVGTYISHWSLWDSIKPAFDKFSAAISSGFSSLFATIIKYLNKIPGINIGTGTPTVPTGGPRLTNTATPAQQAMINSYLPPGDGLTFSQRMANGYKGNSAPLPAASGKTIQVNSTINMDGKKVAEAVTTHQAKEASKPPSSTSAYNASMLQFYSGMNSQQYPR